MSTSKEDHIVTGIEVTCNQGSSVKKVTCCHVSVSRRSRVATGSVSKSHVLPHVQCQEGHVFSWSVWRRSRVATCSVEEGHLSPRVQCQEGHVLPRVQCEDGHMLPRIQCEEGHVLSASSILLLQAGQLALSMAATWSILDKKESLGCSPTYLAT